jgi:conjugal transfer pilus assembly protein TraU
MRNWLLICLCVLSAIFPRENQATTTTSICQGEFANPISDICWSCIFPITIGGFPVYTDNQEDNNNPGSLICTCSNPIIIGTTIGYWEPARRVDVVKKPYCFSALGGKEIDVGTDASEGDTRLHDEENRYSSYNVHWYADPILSYLELVLDWACGDKGGMDISYITEVDPTWNDPELSGIIDAEAYLFANPLAQAACVADCVMANIGFGFKELFWCSGCNGPIYPFYRTVAAHESHIQATSLMIHRMAAKMHREGLARATTGPQGMCGSTLEFVIDKTNYKYEMLYPIPQTEKIAGRCCQPFGRTTLLWGAGRQVPYNESFVYEVFRKQHCCVGFRYGS